MNCEKDACTNEVLEGRRICADHWAEYMRSYRARSGPKKERASYQRGFDEGVTSGFSAGMTACLRYLRDEVGHRALTGYQVARDVEDSVTNTESAEVLARRAFLKSLTPG